MKTLSKGSVVSLIIILCGSCQPYWFYTWGNPVHEGYILVAPEGDPAIISAQDSDKAAAVAFLCSIVPIFSASDSIIQSSIYKFEFYENSTGNGDSLLSLWYQESLANSLSWAYIAPDFFNTKYLPAGYSQDQFFDALNALYNAGSTISEVDTYVDDYRRSIQYTEAVFLIQALQTAGYPYCGTMKPEDTNVQVPRSEVLAEVK